MNSKRFEELPLLKDRSTILWREGGMCYVCGSKLVGEPHSFVAVNGGGLLRLPSGGAQMSDTISGFLSITWHGGHSDMGGIGADLDISAHYDLVSNTNNGQFDLLFCTTQCMRNFFNTCVDELDARIAEEKLKKIAKR